MDHLQYFAFNKDSLFVSRNQNVVASVAMTPLDLLSLCLESEKAFGFRRKVGKLRDVDEETCD